MSLSTPELAHCEPIPAPARPPALARGHAFIIAPVTAQLGERDRLRIAPQHLAGGPRSSVSE